MLSSDRPPVTTCVVDILEHFQMNIPKEESNELLQGAAEVGSVNSYGHIVFHIEMELLKRVLTDLI